MATSVSAQESNVLGLAAVPQGKPAAPQGAAKATGAAGATSAAKGSQAGTPAPAVASRDILAGEMGIQHSAREGVGRIIVTTRNTFATAGAVSSAIEAARGVQRDIAAACGKQCKPQKMAMPKILSSAQLEFELVFAPLHQHLNQTQLQAAVQGRPMNLLPQQLAAPVPVPAPVVTVQGITTTQ